MSAELDFHTFDLAHLVNNAAVVPENCEHAFSSRMFSLELFLLREVGW